MDPTTENDGEKSRPTKWCWFARWIGQTKRQADDGGFAGLAQAALDDRRAPDDAAVGHGSLYRAGLTLAELKPGECGFVRRLFGPAQGRLRLLEMGLTPGTHIRMVRAAAFGGPLDILVRGYQLSLRREEAAGVWLDDDDEEAEPTIVIGSASDSSIDRADAEDPQV